MADQKILLNLSPRKTLRVTVVDTAGSRAKFIDYGDATGISLDRDYTIVSVSAVGTTAPATAAFVQINVDGIDKPQYLPLASIFDPKSSMADRLGSALGAKIRKGATFALVSR